MSIMLIVINVSICFYMDESKFFMCMDCANKQPDPQLPNDMYYCPYVQGILPKGIVHADTDATECVRKGVFREIKIWSH